MEWLVHLALQVHLVQMEMQVLRELQLHLAHLVQRVGQGLLVLLEVLVFLV